MTTWEMACKVQALRIECLTDDSADELGEEAAQYFLAALAHMEIADRELRKCYHIHAKLTEQAQ